MPRASGRFVLRIAPGLHERLRREAVRLECSLNELCAERLRTSLAGSGSVGPGPELVGEAVPPEVRAGILRALGGQLEGLVLFGSAARGERWESSDVDLLVVLRPGARPTRQLYARWDAEIAPLAAGHSHRVSPHFVGLPRRAEGAGGLWLEVALDGVILWDPQSSIARLLSLLRRQIAAGVVVRRLAHGQPYWRRLAKTA